MFVFTINLYFSKQFTYTYLFSIYTLFFLKMLLLFSTWAPSLHPSDGFCLSAPAHRSDSHLFLNTKWNCVYFTLPYSLFLISSWWNEFINSHSSFSLCSFTRMDGDNKGNSRMMEEKNFSFNIHYHAYTYLPRDMYMRWHASLNVYVLVIMYSMGMKIVTTFSWIYIEGLVILTGWLFLCLHSGLQRVQDVANGNGAQEEVAGL